MLVSKEIISEVLLVGVESLKKFVVKESGRFCWQFNFLLGLWEM